MAKIFKVAEDEKCGCCNWRVENLYLIAETEEEAEELYHKTWRLLKSKNDVKIIIDKATP